jgi:hypothetical protein
MSPGPLTVFAFDVSPSRRDSSLVMGQLLANGKIGLAVLETYSSQVAVDEVLVAASIKKWADLYYPRVVCYDKYTTASIAQRLQNAGVQTRDISGQTFYTACSDMYDALVNDRLRHSGQDALIQQMANCAAKQTPDAWRIVAQVCRACRYTYWPCYGYTYIGAACSRGKGIRLDTPKAKL